MSRSTSASRYFSGTVAMARATAPCNCSRSSPASRLSVESASCGRLSENTSVSASNENQFRRLTRRRISFFARFAAIVNTQVENLDPRR
jgi:hypothetical protein